MRKCSHSVTFKSWNSRRRETLERCTDCGAVVEPDVIKPDESIVISRLAWALIVAFWIFVGYLIVLGIRWAFS